MSLLAKLILYVVPFLFGGILLFLAKNNLIGSDPTANLIAVVGLLVGAIFSFAIRLIYEFHGLAGSIRALKGGQENNAFSHVASTNLAAHVHESMTRNGVDLDVYDALGSNIRRINSFENAFAHYLLANKISEINEQLGGISRGEYQSTPFEEPYLNSKILELSVCRKTMKAVDFGDPSFWVSEPGQAYLERLAELSKTGIEIDRIFILPSGEIDERWGRVINFHKQKKMNYKVVMEENVPEEERLNFVIYDGQVLRDAELDEGTTSIGRTATFYFKNKENRFRFDQRQKLFDVLKSR